MPLPQILGSEQLIEELCIYILAFTLVVGVVIENWTEHCIESTALKRGIGPSLQDTSLV